MPKRPTRSRQPTRSDLPQGGQARGVAALLVELTLRLAGLDRHFRAVLGPDDGGASKPAPDMLLEACRRLGVRPRDAVMIGDSDYDEDASRAAGVPFIRFRSFSSLQRGRP